MKSLSFILLLILSIPQAARAWDIDQPFAPEATTAAQAALTALGEGKGALNVVFPKPLKIVGLPALALTASVEELNQAIATLDAEVTKTKIRIDLSSDVLFDFDSAEIKAKAEAELRAVATIVNQKASKVEIIGHTDAKGSDAYNQKLSEQRALSVKRWVLQHSQFSAELISTLGQGETQPVQPNQMEDGSDNPDGRAKNRRVVILVYTQQ